MTYNHMGSTIGQIHLDMLHLCVLGMNASVKS